MLETLATLNPDDMPWYAAYAFNILAAFAIVIVAFWISSRVRTLIVRVGHRYDDLDDTLFTFLGSFSRYAIMALAGIFVLGRFGIETTSLAALIGAAGLAIGLAFQGTLSNFASGVMLLAFRPVNIGDYVRLGAHEGTIKQISVFVTELATLDNVQIIIPNSDVWSSAIVNYSAYPTRRAQLVLSVAYDTDLKKAETVIRQTAEADPRAMLDPALWLQVTNLGDSSVDFTLRVWCARADYWDFRNDLMRAIKEAFDAEGIEIPFPTTTIQTVTPSG